MPYSPLNRFLIFLDILLRETRSKKHTAGLLSQIRETGGPFKKIEDSKKEVVELQQDNSSVSSKFNFVCMGNIGDNKTRLLVSEKQMPHESFSTTILNKAPVDVVKKIKDVARGRPKSKKMLVMSSKDFTFEVKSQITRTVKSLDGSIISDQLVSEMPMHQYRFDDQIMSLMTLVPVLFNHGSSFDADQLVNILLPHSSNPEKDGRICIIQPTKQHIPFMHNLLRYIFAMSKRMHRLMADDIKPNKHMDKAQGASFFSVIGKCNTNVAKQRNDLYKMLFDKKKGSIGGIYEDMLNFKTIYPKADKIFEKAVSEIYVMNSC